MRTVRLAVRELVTMGSVVTFGDPAGDPDDEPIRRGAVWLAVQVVVAAAVLGLALLVRDVLGRLPAWPGPLAIWAIPAVLLLLVDRIDRRMVSVASDALAALSAAALPVVDALWGLDMTWFIALAVVGAVIRMPGMTAHETLLLATAATSVLAAAWTLVLDPRSGAVERAVARHGGAVGRAVGDLVASWRFLARRRIVLGATLATAMLAGVLSSLQTTLMPAYTPARTCPRWPG